jgi:uncharacterized membrane protein (DUF106 family)
MLELTVDILDPVVTRFQLILASFIALLAIFFTLIKSLLAEREASRQKKIMKEMREYKEEVRRQEDKKRREDMRRWEEGEEWPIQFDEDEAEVTKEGPRGRKGKARRGRKGGGDG